MQEALINEQEKGKEAEAVVKERSEVISNCFMSFLLALCSITVPIECPKGPTWSKYIAAEKGFKMI